MAASYDSTLRRLAEMYGVWQAYVTVCETCMLPELPKMRERRKADFLTELRAYARRRYPDSTARNAMARAMDDVLYTRNQLTLF